MVIPCKGGHSKNAGRCRALTEGGRALQLHGVIKIRGIYITPWFLRPHLDEHVEGHIVSSLKLII